MTAMCQFLISGLKTGRLIFSELMSEPVEKHVLKRTDFSVL